jgi:KTSC domain
MQQTFFESSALFRVNYDAVAGLLEVEFRDHTIYRYRGVSAEMHAALLGAESKGKFFNTAIRNQFPFVCDAPSHPSST